MATRSWQAPQRSDDDTTYRQWAQGISDALRQFLTQTADTGQIAQPIVVPRPAASGVAGYEIFRFNDARQADYPLFVKAEYALSSVLTTPILVISVGTGTDGAGGVTGVKLGRSSVQRSQPAISGPLENAASGGDGWFCLATGVIGAGAQWLLIERGRNIDGTPNADVAYAWFPGGPSVAAWVTMPRDAPGVQATSMPVLQAAAGEVASRNGEVPVYPIEPFFGRRRPPLLGFIVCAPVDVGQGVVLQTEMYGQMRTFRRFSEGAASSSVRSGIIPALCLRWE